MEVTESRQLVTTNMKCVAKKQHCCKKETLSGIMECCKKTTLFDMIA